MENYHRTVFVNCPIDNQYWAMFAAIYFAVHDSGFQLSCGPQRADSTEIRASKILQQIEEARFAIHDLSRTQITKDGHPRLNMSYELGIFVGARHFGNKLQKQKRCLILDCEDYRYKAMLSDIGGQDIGNHSNDPVKAIEHVRNWLSAQLREKKVYLPGVAEMQRRYRRFQKEMPKLCHAGRILPEELVWNLPDYGQIVDAWLEENRAIEGVARLEQQSRFTGGSGD